MTFSALMGQMTKSRSTSEYIPTGTDEDEARIHHDALKHSGVVGVGEPINYDEDFADAGFDREDA